MDALLLYVLALTVSLHLATLRLLWGLRAEVMTRAECKEIRARERRILHV